MNTQIKAVGLSFASTLMPASYFLTGGFVVAAPSACGTVPAQTAARPPVDGVQDNQALARMDELIHLHRLTAGERPDGRLGQQHVRTDGR